MSSSSSSVLCALPPISSDVTMRLTHENHLMWKAQILAYLRTHKLLSIVNGGEPALAKTTKTTSGTGTDLSPRRSPIPPMLPGTPKTRPSLVASSPPSSRTCCRTLWLPLRRREPGGSWSASSPPLVCPPELDQGAACDAQESRHVRLELLQAEENPR
jgi:hypothetical protein